VALPNYIFEILSPLSLFLLLWDEGGARSSPCPCLL
jgi:hypothetical protein